MVEQILDESDAVGLMQLQCEEAKDDASAMIFPTTDTLALQKQVGRGFSCFIIGRRRRSSAVPLVLADHWVKFIPRTGMPTSLKIAQNFKRVIAPFHAEAGPGVFRAVARFR